MEELELRELPAAEARKRLIALARAHGPAALETLHAALDDPALAEAALEALAEVPVQEAWDLLEQASQEGPAGLRKAARRGQHRLRSRGFRPAPSTPPHEAAHAAVEARATPFDLSGNQLLRLVQPAALGMARYASFIVGPEGLIECSHILTSRADLDEFLVHEDAGLGEDLIDVSLAYVARRARAAVAHNRAIGKALPRDWPEAVRLLEGAPEDPLPAELAAWAAESKAVTPREAAGLFRHRSMARWRLDPNRLMPYARDWLHLLEHQPLRTEEGLPNLGALQSQGQLTARVIADLCDAAMIARWIGQLAEQARLFYILGAPDLAGLAMRCSVDLEQRAGPDAPFLRALVEKSMESAVRILQEEEESRSPWVQAGSAAGPLWLPRPAAPEGDEEEEQAPRLWLPGQP